MQRRSGPVSGSSGSVSSISVVARLLGWLALFLALEPMGAGGHDHRVGGFFVHGFLADDFLQLVARQVGQIVERFHALLAQRHQHRRGEKLERRDIVGDAEFDPLFLQLVVLARQELFRSTLDSATAELTARLGADLIALSRAPAFSPSIASRTVSSRMASSIFGR